MKRHLCINGSMTNASDARNRSKSAARPLTAGMGGKRTFVETRSKRGTGHATDDWMVTALDSQAAISRLDLTRWLLRTAGLSEAADGLRDDRPVHAMDDGGMGSFTLMPSHTGGHAVAEATYDDDNGVEVKITLFADEDGQPVEVGFWKVDFEPLSSFPSQNQLKDAKAL